VPGLDPDIHPLRKKDLLRKINKEEEEDGLPGQARQWRLTRVNARARFPRSRLAPQ
jgi:hypothetical protein